MFSVCIYRKKFTMLIDTNALVKSLAFANIDF